MSKFLKSPIIAAVEYKDLDKAIKSNACAIWLMYSNVNDLLKQEFQECAEKKPIFIHFDLVKGLSSDKESVEFIAQNVKPAGIITTKGNIIRSAKKYNLITVQRIFLIDSKSLSTAVANVLENDPHAVEIMPAIAPQIINDIRRSIKCPIIVGGLIKTKDEIEHALKCGAEAVSLSKEELWNYQ